MELKMDISVVIPVFNAATYVEKAIKSALIQEEVKEIVIIDDGSTDGSLTIIESLQKENAIIQVYYHQNNCKLFF